MLKPKPWYIPIPSYFWITITPHIYHPKGIDPNQFPNIIAHENIHLSQQAIGNKYLWYLKYIFSRSFRLNMEARAIAAELDYDNLHNNTDAARRGLEGYVDALTSINYTWAASSKDIARKMILSYMVTKNV